MCVKQQQQTTQKPVDTEKRVLVIRGKGLGMGRVKGVKGMRCMVTNGNSTFGDKHSVGYIEAEI